MTLDEITTELAQINAAVAAVMGGAQSYSIGGKTLTRAAYPALIARRKELYRARKILSAGGVVSYPIFETRS